MKNISLRNSQDFSLVYSNGKRVRTNALSFKFCKNEMLQPRLGQAISVRQCKLAVHRNKLKRRNREIFNKLQNQFPAIDIVVSLNKIISNTDIAGSYQVLLEDWKKFNQQVRVF